MHLVSGDARASWRAVSFDAYSSVWAFDIACRATTGTCYREWDRVCATRKGSDGGGYGDTAHAMPCAERVDVEPTNGEAMYVSCGGLELLGNGQLGGFVTVMQLGDVRGLFLSEIVAYEPPPVPGLWASVSYLPVRSGCSASPRHRWCCARAVMVL